MLSRVIYLFLFCQKPKKLKLLMHAVSVFHGWRQQALQLHAAALKTCWWWSMMTAQPDKLWLTCGGQVVDILFIFSQSSSLHWEVQIFPAADRFSVILQRKYPFTVNYTSCFIRTTVWFRHWRGNPVAICLRITQQDDSFVWFISVHHKSPFQKFPDLIP